MSSVDFQASPKTYPSTVCNYAVFFAQIFPALLLYFTISVIYSLICTKESLITFCFLWASNPIYESKCKCKLTCQQNSKFIVLISIQMFHTKLFGVQATFITRCYLLFLRATFYDFGIKYFLQSFDTYYSIFKLEFASRQ